MKIWLIRHGETEYNAQGRYQGQRDIPLSARGRSRLRRAGFAPAVVYVSPLLRARQTAAVLFPGAEQIAVDGLREMSFGSFEGHSYEELKDDPVFRAWFDSGWLTGCPGGESRAEFSDRACAAFSALVNEALGRREDQLIIVTHGGVQMAVMQRYAVPRRSFHEWLPPNAGGYVLRADQWETEGVLSVLETVRFGIP